MCGISGIFGAKRADCVRGMLRTIVHRGPDDEYVVEGEGYTLGARRLSIIDVDGGRQPVSTADENVWVAQNGEIYNFPALRDRLLDAGHAFRTRCDTEVIAHLYEADGVRAISELEGMFAIAIFDRRKRTGILARDRTGKKPLYYTVHQGSLYFASEIKSLLAVAGIPRVVEWEAIHHFLSYKHVPCPLTAFRGIHMLPPAHMLIWKEGAIERIERYWTLSWSARPGPLVEEELVEELLEKLRAGVKRRLISDVPIGFFLSGGIDSSLSTCIAAEMAGDRIKTFTLSYGEESATEGKRLDVECARRIAQKYGTEHHEERIDFSDFPEQFPEIIRHFDEPFGGVVSTYFLARLISRHVKVALSGDGADELFGSYLSHRLAQPLAAFQPDAGEVFEGRAGLLERLYSPDDYEWRYRLLLLSDNEKRALYAPELRHLTEGFSTREHMRAAFRSLSARDPLNRILEFEFATFFPDQVLAFVDRLSMAHSLEVRTAFLDTAFVEFAASLPPEWKIRGNETKYLLKKAALRYLPHDVVYRPKEGFVMPINNWLVSHLHDYVHDMLGADRLGRQGYFDPGAVGRMVDEFYGGTTGHAGKILALLAFQVWHDVCLRGASEPSPATL